MGPALAHFVGLFALLSGANPTDTATYADRATRDLVALAMSRHYAQDSTVHDYTAKIRYRLSFAFGKRKWADPATVAVEEQDATVAWQLPNNLRVNILGRRTESRLASVDLTSTFSRPWFVPRTLGDSIRIFGADDAPSRAAPHPLSHGAERLYRYAAGDSVIITMGGRQLTIRSITVIPKLKDGAYVAGQLWVDVATGEVARFTFRFVGTELWSMSDKKTTDSTAERSSSEFVSRILEIDADLEYGLQDKVHWMPYRQVISGRATMPFGIDFAVPFEAATTFDNYVINSGTPVVFDAPFPRDSTARRGYSRVPVNRPPNGGRGARPRFAVDSTRPRNRTGFLAGGGRYEMHRVPLDSLHTYNGWGDSLVMENNSADDRRVREASGDLARLVDGLPREMTGRPGTGFSLENISDILRYNRVEGTTFSGGMHFPTNISFTDLYATARYGLADGRVMGRFSAVRDAPSGRLTLAVSRDLADIDPFAHGLTFGNSIRASFTGHDDGAYLLAQGGRADYERSLGTGTELDLGARIENESSVGDAARAALPRLFGADGYFPSNDPVRAGFATGATASIDHTGQRVHWTLDGEALAVAGDAGARIAASLKLPHLVHGWLTAQFKAGGAAGAAAVPQLQLRAGGINTVRGYDFGVEQGNAMWAVQLDASRPKGAVKPVFFLDAGGAGDIAHAAATPFLSGGGVGLSVLGGLVRADLSHPITNTQGHGVRFDLIFGGPR
ncbi:MAG TPA: hypothetical protein VHW65_13265 [Gemmatimonadales bacterium]|jgi:hypothetical protein|nr:hypothetical protein [Gemmatimonadales bacterium]